MSKQKRNSLVFRLSLVSAVAIALFWVGYYLVKGSVPVVAVFPLGLGEEILLPFGVSRWFDILIGPLYSWAIIQTYYLVKQMDGDDEILVNGLVNGLMINLMFGLMIGLTGGLVDGLYLGLWLNLVVGLMFGLEVGLMFALGYIFSYTFLTSLILGLPTTFLVVPFVAPIALFYFILVKIRAGFLKKRQVD